MDTDPTGDITKVDPKTIPNHDILFAGFPCQPFSIIGQMKGFDDIRGTLFFHIANIFKVMKLKAFVLENVKQLAGHNQGLTLKVITKTLQFLGYHVQYSFNCFGLWVTSKKRKGFNCWTQRPNYVLAPITGKTV